MTLKDQKINKQKRIDVGVEKSTPVNEKITEGRQRARHMSNF